MKFTRVLLLLLISQQAFAQQNQAVIEIDTTSFRDSAKYKFAFDFYKTRVYQNPKNFYNYYQAENPLVKLSYLLTCLTQF